MSVVGHPPTNLVDLRLMAEKAGNYCEWTKVSHQNMQSVGGRKTIDSVECFKFQHKVSIYDIMVPKHRDFRVEPDHFFKVLHE